MVEMFLSVTMLTLLAYDKQKENPFHRLTSDAHSQRGALDQQQI